MLLCRVSVLAVRRRGQGREDGFLELDLLDELGENLTIDDDENVLKIDA